MVPVDGFIVTTFVVGVVSLVILFSLLKWNKNPYRRLNKILKPYKNKEIKKVVIPDGVGGLVEVEHLLLLEQGLLLVKIFESDGHIFGGDSIEQWTEIMNGRSYKFANPLHHMQTVQQALAPLMPDTPIYYRVVFIGQSTFPKGQPSQVSILDTLEKDLSFLVSKPKLGQKLIDRWDRLLRIARTH